MSRLATFAARGFVILVAGAGAAGAQSASSSVQSAQRSASDNPHGPLPVECSACHAPEAWKPIRLSDAFKHAPGTFPLDGAHARTGCMGCHKRLDFLATPHHVPPVTRMCTVVSWEPIVLVAIQRVASPRNRR